MTRDLKPANHDHLNDVEILGGSRHLVTVSIGGKVRFYDLQTLTEFKCLSLTNLAQNVASDYGFLRNTFLEDAADLICSNLAAFSERFVDQPYVLALAAEGIGSQSLICGALLRDERVLAVASTEGFVFLIDTRDGEVFRTIDVGGGLGKELQWMCADVNSNSFVTLLRDGTMIRYRGVDPKF